MNPDRPLRGDGDVGVEVTKGCGCLSCTDDAVAVIRHPEYGRRTVCGAHINGYDVVEWLVARDEIDGDQEVTTGD
ncbi:hypothetical protein [Halobellus rubicundus]|uniref:Uncharacterized protein n=1 Tax=Halobellus rubicundus TaxID=2996466 RepID=A0ABD5MJ47_9EURY